MDLRTLPQQDVPEAVQHIVQTNSLILDLRGYTMGGMSRLATYLAPKRVIIARSQTPLFVPCLLVEGIEPTLNVATQTYNPDGKKYYGGKIVALIDSSTKNQSEIACHSLRACRPDTIFVGAPTAGSVGHVTNVILPANIEVFFTGIGFSFPDGKVVQQQGIIPDVPVIESVSDIMREEDQILNEAISYLQKV